MAQTQATQGRSTRWSLEVVRGRDLGKVFELAGSEIVLGNGPGGAGGIDLRDQEAGSPRRMAARQASLALEGGDLVIRDLDSPGGTFVNRQRLLSGQARRLQAGDEIQLGGVQLRVAVARSVAEPPPAARSPSLGQPSPAPTSRLAFPYKIDGGVACRTWDDFLTVAAQRWNDLRDELATGRIADYLRRIQRTDLLPHAEAARSLDEQLDHWLGRLPVSRPGGPELDVHPTGLEVRASGGSTRHVLQISNVGNRLLRSTAQVEPAGATWVRILPPYEGLPFDTIEQTELPVEVTAPESPGRPLD